MNKCAGLAFLDIRLAWNDTCPPNCYLNRFKKIGLKAACEEAERYELYSDFWDVFFTNLRKGFATWALHAGITRAQWIFRNGQNLRQFLRGDLRNPKPQPVGMGMPRRLDGYPTCPYRVYLI